MSKFELTHPLSEADEKRLATHQKNIGVYADGVKKSKAQLFGYAFLAGHEMNCASEIVQHGEFEKWVGARFPEISTRTARYWREFADAVKTKSAMIADLKPLQLKKSFSKREQKTILEEIPKLLDGRGMIEFLRSVELLPPAPAIGGGPGGGSDPRSPSAAEQIEAANYVVNERINFLTAWAAEDSATDLKLCDLKHLRALEESRLALGRSIAAAIDARK